MTRENLLQLLGQQFFTIRWADDERAVEIIDQRKLPLSEEYLLVRTVEGLIEAIKDMAIRGAPALGIAGAMGVALAAVEVVSRREKAACGEAIDQEIREAAKKLSSARPTAVNLSCGVSRMLSCWEENSRLPMAERTAKLVSEAEAVLLEDVEMCRRIGENGQLLIPDGAAVMTICNAGALATGGHGTALSIIRAARRAGKRIRVLVCETRPLLQGARLTAWELGRDGFDVTVVCDSAAGYLLASGATAAVITGADRIARNGDFANKIGTYSLSVLAAASGVPFYVAAPSSTLDPETLDGSGIHIEERPAEEVTAPFGIRWAAEGVKVRNPAFDVTPAANVTRIITEKGVFLPGEVMLGQAV